MIVFDLVCRDGGHQFEGWFGSSTDYEKQLQAGLIDCPSCGCTSVDKAVMAPNVGIKGNQRAGSQPVTTNAQEPASADEVGQSVSNQVAVSAEYQELIGKLAQAQAKMLEQSEWVGSDFPEQARAIHYGEKDIVPIHGTASAEDAAELEDEGIELTQLPLPVTPPEEQN
ncbi:DUF1178 family protein [Sphingorhabdus sp. Alg231-15]|uniref:DUF1178 family protein n=1 Tax=Sphingorhabdus sp. Alg231-15 TaxID=1922222 RepID=UPI000D5503AA